MDDQVSPLKAFSQALLVAGDRFKNLVVLDTDATANLGTSLFKDKFGARYFNLGNSKGDIVDTAAGFSVAGKLPVVFSRAIDLYAGALEQIRNSICEPNLNVKFFAIFGGLDAGQEGAPRFALEDFAVMRTIPNMKVFCPADSVETKKMTYAVLNDFGPCYARLGNQPVSKIYDEKYGFNIGRGNIIAEGDDVGIITTGNLVSSCLKAAEKLREDGVSVRIINMSSIKPIDGMLIQETAKKVKVLAVAEDHQISGGLAGAVADILSHAKMKPFHRIGIHDAFGESGKKEDLYKKYKLDAEGVYEQIRPLSQTMV